MKPTLVQKIAGFTRTTAAALVALACARFANVSTAAAFAEDEKPQAAAPAQPPSPGRERTPSSAAPPASATTPPTPPPAGETVRAQLMVNVGTERAEVFVDGAKVGSSPYLGTISCRKGAKLDIEVVITKGVVYGYERTCEAGTIRVDAAP
jgi:hypothetical protein